MVVQGFVDAGNGLDLLQHRADVVADENNGAILVYLCQQFVEAGFETLVDVCAGFVENHHLRVGDDGTAPGGHVATVRRSKRRWHAAPCLPAPCGLSRQRLSRGVGR